MENILIRKAKKEDSTQIAHLLMHAMEDIAYYYVGDNSKEKATNFLSELIQEENNQYSYKYSWVVEENKNTIGVAIVYNGAKLLSLREPVLQKIKKQFDRNIQLEEETQAGEYYIDCIAVSKKSRGKGIGTRILQFILEEYAHNQGETLGLLVYKDNPEAKKLYKKIGFKSVGTKLLLGKELEHMQYRK